MEIRVMRNMNWMITAVFAASLSAFAQQTEAPAAPAQSTTQASTPSSSQPQAPASLPAPTTMDQVVDRFIDREHQLAKMLATRTPIVETYLQNLIQDPQLGPVPKDDRYFLGRMDLSESIDRTTYLKDESMEKSLLGGF